MRYFSQSQMISFSIFFLKLDSVILINLVKNQNKIFLTWFANKQQRIRFGSFCKIFKICLGFGNKRSC